jgi:hypothetical protein
MAVNQPPVTPRGRLVGYAVLVAILGLVAFMIWAGARGKFGISQTAETLSAPFPAVLTHVDAPDRRCKGTPTECRVMFTLRITNPTDRIAYVQACHLIAQFDPSGPLSVDVFISAGPAGVAIPAGTTWRAFGQQQLPIAQKNVNPNRATVSCTGLDWHGNPPI